MGERVAVAGWQWYRWIGEISAVRMVCVAMCQWQYRQSYTQQPRNVAVAGKKKKSDSRQCYKTRSKTGFLKQKKQQNTLKKHSKMHQNTRKNTK
jgi:hypothetical protein